MTYSEADLKRIAPSEFLYAKAVIKTLKPDLDQSGPAQPQEPSTEPSVPPTSEQPEPVPDSPKRHRTAAGQKDVAKPVKVAKGHERLANAGVPGSLAGVGLASVGVGLLVRSSRKRS